MQHNTAARDCVEFDDYLPITDDACEACDELQAAVRLDPDLYDDQGNALDITHAEPYDPVVAAEAMLRFDVGTGA
jgi:hypothetical protein